MTVEEAIQLVIKRFPFEGYIAPDRLKGAYSIIARTVLTHLRPGSKILDFGCAPCDKTAVLQFIGF
jgi:hypothetical protein